MKNFLSEGEVITVTAPRSVASGDVVIVGSLGGVAITSATQSAPVALMTEGIFELTKKNGAVFTAGDRVSWSATGTSTWCDLPATHRSPIGFAMSSAASNATVMEVMLACIDHRAAT